jgi:hypothetical protein
MRTIRYPHIEQAREVVETERTYIQREIEAFDRFLVRLADIPSEVHAAANAQTQTTVVRSVSPSVGRGAGRLEALTTAYRETVMAVPHYEDEYGDSLAESLTAEFGSTLAFQLIRGEALTGRTREAVLDAARGSRDRRHRLLQILDAEAESLEDASEELRSIEQEYLSLKDRIDAETQSSTLSAIDSQLEPLEQQCLDIVEHRQQRVREESVAFRTDENITILEFLYEGMRPATPVVQTAGDILERVREARKRCLK